MDNLEIRDIVQDELRDSFKRYFYRGYCPKCHATPLLKIRIEIDEKDEFDIEDVIHCVHCNTTFKETLVEKSK